MFLYHGLGFSDPVLNIDDAPSFNRQHLFVKPCLFAFL